MLFNRMSPAGQHDRATSQGPIVDPTLSGSSFYTVPDPYAEGRRQREATEESGTDPETDV
jgi:hypothetical protein